MSGERFEGNRGQRDVGDDRERLLNTRCPVVLLRWLSGPEVQESKESAVKLDGDVIDTVGIFGRVVVFAPDAGKIRMVLDDGTGQITLNVNRRESEARPIVFGKVDVKVGMYLSAVIQCSRYDGRLVFTLLHVEEMRDHNRITLYILEALTGRKYRRSREIPYNLSGHKPRGDTDHKRFEEDTQSIDQSVSNGRHEREPNSADIFSALTGFIRNTGDRTRRPVPLASIVQAMVAMRLSREQVRAHLDSLEADYIIRRVRGLEEYEVC
jgi:hypothetical protein